MSDVPTTLHYEEAWFKMAIYGFARMIKDGQYGPCISNAEWEGQTVWLRRLFKQK